MFFCSAVNRFEHKNLSGSRVFSSGISYWYSATAVMLFRDESLFIPGYSHMINLFELPITDFKNQGERNIFCY